MRLPRVLTNLVVLSWVVLVGIAGSAFIPVAAAAAERPRPDPGELWSEFPLEQEGDAPESGAAPPSRAAPTRPGIAVATRSRELPSWLWTVLASTALAAGVGGVLLVARQRQHGRY